MRATHNIAILNEVICSSYISNDLYVSTDWGKTGILIN